MTTLMINDLNDLAIAEELAIEPNANGIRELSGEELRHVSGGMKWQKGTANPDVVDARGGSIVIFGLIGTFDINGNLSSVRPA